MLRAMFAKIMNALRKKRMLEAKKAYCGVYPLTNGEIKMERSSAVCGLLAQAEGQPVGQAWVWCLNRAPYHISPGVH